MVDKKFDSYDHSFNFASVSFFVVPDRAWLLVDAVRSVVSGDEKFYHSVQHLITETETRPFKNNRVSIFSLLSSRERQVLQMVAEGNNNKYIAERLGISIRTVDVHRAHLKNKLKIDNVAQLTKLAVSEGITSPNL